MHKTNEEFFKPRGLYCLIMTFDPNSNAAFQEVDITSTIASGDEQRSGMSNLRNKYRAADATTNAAWQFPETAPLVFPGLDELASMTEGDSKKKQGAMARKSEWVAKYMDKRATADFVSAQGLNSFIFKMPQTDTSTLSVLIQADKDAFQVAKNPDNPLANVPQEKFKSRYADPNNPAASGSLISFVSGGHLVPANESRGLIGGLISAVDQKMKGAPTYQQGQPNPAQQGGAYGYQSYQGRRQGRGGLLGLGGGPISMYKKMMNQVRPGLLLLSADIVLSR